MKYTTNYELKKPECDPEGIDDPVNVDDFNDNFDVIDLALNTFEAAIALINQTLPFTMRRDVAQTMTANLKANGGLDYSTSKVRNIIAIEEGTPEPPVEEGALLVIYEAGD